MEEKTTFSNSAAFPFSPHRHHPDSFRGYTMEKRMREYHLTFRLLVMMVEVPEGFYFCRAEFETE